MDEKLTCDISGKLLPVFIRPNIIGNSLFITIERRPENMKIMNKIHINEFLHFCL